VYIDHVRPRQSRPCWCVTRIHVNTLFDNSAGEESDSIDNQDGRREEGVLQDGPEELGQHYQAFGRSTSCVRC
jgi:hypothetical protein